MNLNQIHTKLNDILAELSEVEDPTLNLIKNNDLDNPSGFNEIDTWRGSYDEPNLFLGDDHSTLTLINQLEEALDGKIYPGYKGGNFTFTDNQDLRVEPYYGSWSGDSVIFDIQWDAPSQTINIFYAV